MQVLDQVCFLFICLVLATLDFKAKSQNFLDRTQLNKSKLALFFKWEVIFLRIEQNLDIRLSLKLGLLH